MRVGKPFGPPREIKIRRYRRTHRGIPSVDTVDGKAEFTYVGDVERTEPLVKFSLDDDGEIKQYSWYSRDGDLDGNVQDGTPWQRRSRSIAYLRIGKGKKKKPTRMRLRDMPFPLTGSVEAQNTPSIPIPKEVSEKKDIFSASPSTSTSQVAVDSFGAVERGGVVRAGSAELDIVGAVRRHNRKMRRIGKPIWSRTSYSKLKRISDRAMASGKPNAEIARQRRIGAFLKMLEDGMPESDSYIADNDLLDDAHPWKTKGTQQFIKTALSAQAEPARNGRYKEIHESLKKAAKAPILPTIAGGAVLPTFGGGADIGGGKRLSVDGPGIRQAVSKGALVDEAGKIRCPIGTPGAMQFTNWQLEGCGRPSARRLSTAIYEAVSEADLQDFIAAGGRQITQVEIAKALAERQRTAVTTAAEAQAEKRRRVAKRLRETVSPPKGKKDRNKEMRLMSLLRDTKDSETQRIAIDLDNGDVIGEGLLIPRSDLSFNINTKNLFDDNDNINEEELANAVLWLDAVIEQTPASGSSKLVATITRLEPPKEPRKPVSPPLKGRAQTLAEQAGGDPAELMRLLDAEGFVVFDFETTGMNDGNVPVSVSAIRYQGGVEVARKTIYMNPERALSQWSRDNLTDPDGNPLTDEWLQTQGSVADGIQDISAFIGNSILVAHNMDFDLNILNEQLKKLDIESPHSGSIDTLEMARQILPKSVQPRHDLGSLKERFAVTSGAWHTSDGDSEATGQLLRALLGHGADNGVPDTLFDAAEQQRRYDDAMAVYNTEMPVYVKAMAQYKDRWGTDKKIVRFDVADIIPDNTNSSAKKRKASLKKAEELAAAQGGRSVVRLSDGLIIDVDGGRSGLVDVTSPDPTSARMFNAKTSLNAAFSKLEGRDNMNLDAFSSEQVKDMLTSMQALPGFKWIDPDNPDHLYLAIDQGANNLLQLMNMATPEERKRWKMWYDGASTYAGDLAAKYGVSKETAVAVIATLSPTTDWDANIALAEHAIKLATDKDFRIDDQIGQALLLAMIDAHKSRVSNTKSDLKKKRAELQELINQLNNESTLPDGVKRAEKIRKLIAAKEKSIVDAENKLEALITQPKYSASDFIGKGMADLDDDAAKRVFAIHARLKGRSYIGQTYTGETSSKNDAKKAANDALLTYVMDVRSPNEYNLESGVSLARVQSSSNYLKALTIIRAERDGKPDMQVIGKNIGHGSKVRSFFNNILRPNDRRYADLTGDTHYYGAATAVPVSSSHNVLDSLFTTVTTTGSGRAYPIFRAMGVLAASRWNETHKTELLPREIQSITWEKIRRIVPTRFIGHDGKETMDTSLKSYITDVMGVVVDYTSGPESVRRLTPKLRAFRREYSGREMELLQELSLLLQKTPRNERNDVLAAWMKRYGIPPLKDEDRLSKDVKKKANGVVLEVDKETGNLFDPVTGEIIEREDD